MTDNSTSSTNSNPLILVVDDQAIIREPIAARLIAEGYRTAQAEDGLGAITLMQQRRPDLVLLDIAMPKMNGMAVLQFIRQNSSWASLPVILLTCISDRRFLAMAARLGVRDYLLKADFSLSEMLARIAKYCPVAQSVPAPETLPSSPGPYQQSPPAANAVAKADNASEATTVLTRDDCLARVEKALEGRALSGIVTEVLMLVNSPRSALADLASVIGRDPALTARILHTANSAAFRGSRKMVVTLPEAVKQLGCGNIRNIAMTLGIVEVMPAGQSDDFDPVRSWQHSFAVALLSEHLCQASPDENDSAIAYVVGLCHDLGEILFRTEFGAEYSQILQACNRDGVPLHELERKTLGVTQGDLAAIILKKLGLPDNIRRPIEQYHSSLNHPARMPLGRVARVLHLADLFANGMLMAAAVGSCVSPVIKTEVRELFGKDDPSLPDVDALRAQILALTGLLANLSAADHAKLTQPLIKPIQKRVLYIRDRSCSAFDPLATVLKMLATVTMFAKLPEKIESDSYDAIVMARGEAPPHDIKLPVLYIDPDPPVRAGNAKAQASTALVTTVPTISLENLVSYLTGPPAAARSAA
jgi:HD-like signal output (HDOD) protein/ActR/RegA family two-component response regulator